MKKEEVQFRSRDLVLCGELYMPDRTPARGILVCHAMHSKGFSIVEYGTHFQKGEREGRINDVRFV